MGLLVSMAIYIILAYCTTHTFSMLTSGPFLLTATSVNRAVSTISDASTSAVFCIFLICADGNLTLSSSSML